jgi:hypothetical protein
MANILLGFENSNGNMTDRKTGELIQWDNMIIHVITDNREEVTGWFCDHIKCKTKNINVIGAANLQELLFRPVYLQYDITAKEPTISAVIAAPLDMTIVYPAFPILNVSPQPAGKDK